jgi:repressor of nif and glnA expression
MSFMALRNAFTHISENTLTPKASLVLLVLSNRHNQETGRCDPSLAKIAADANMSERTVRYALRELEQLKIIQTIFRKATTGRGIKNMTSRYRLKGGAKSAGRVGHNLPPKQEYTPSAFDDLVIEEDCYLSEEKKIWPDRGNSGDQCDE